MAINLTEFFENVEKIELNTKVNNMIVHGLDIDMYYAVINYLKNRKPEIINYEDFKSEYDVVSDHLTNVVVNMENIDIKELFNEILKSLELKERVSFENKMDILKFKKFLLEYNKMIQIILYNIDGLPEVDQKLINELFRYKTYAYNIICILKNSKHLGTYETTSGQMLDDREDFTKINIMTE